MIAARRLVPMLVLLAACRPSAPEGADARARDRPNVLLVTLDTTRADALGCYGRSGNPTPCLDAIAAEGTRFERAIATASLTPVSHASILTGLDNAHHGVRVIAAGAGTALVPGIPTLASVLRERGYRTGAALSAFPVSAAYGLDRGFDAYDCPSGALEPGPAGQPTWNLSTLQRRADATTDRAIEWLAAGEGPFLLWVHYFDPHDGVLLPPASALPPGVALPPPASPPPIELSRALYDAEVRFMDAQLARLVAELRRRGLWDRTLTVVVADHGEGLGDHGWPFHRLLYEEQIRVPLLLRLPARGGTARPPHGDLVRPLVRTTDILPTVLDYLGIDAPPRLDGASLRGLVEGRAEPPRCALADAINGYDENALGIRARPLDDFLYCATDARWKLVYRPAHPAESELFDLETDPRELANRFAENPGEARALEEHLAASRPWVAAPFPPLAGPQARPGAEHASRALSGLGYTQGEVSTVAWAWTCPRHPEFRAETDSPCPQCGSPLLLVRR